MEPDGLDDLWTEAPNEVLRAADLVRSGSSSENPADVMEQRSDHELVGKAFLLGDGRRLEAMPEHRDGLAEVGAPPGGPERIEQLEHVADHRANHSSAQRGSPGAPAVPSVAARAAGSCSSKPGSRVLGRGADAPPPSPTSS
jgi:hypothetical protein